MPDPPPAPRASCRCCSCTACGCNAGVWIRIAPLSAMRAASRPCTRCRTARRSRRSSTFADAARARRSTRSCARPARVARRRRRATAWAGSSRAPTCATTAARKVAPRSSRIGTPHAGQRARVDDAGASLAADAPRQRVARRPRRAAARSGVPPIVSLWSWHDSMVTPQTSSRLPCGDNVVITGVAHNALLRDREVFAQRAAASAESRAPLVAACRAPRAPTPGVEGVHAQPAASPLRSRRPAYQWMPWVICAKAICSGRELRLLAAALLLALRGGRVREHVERGVEQDLRQPCGATAWQIAPKMPRRVAMRTGL